MALVLASSESISHWLYWIWVKLPAASYRTPPCSPLLPKAHHTNPTQLVLRCYLISKLRCSQGKVCLGKSEALLGLAVLIILGSGLILVVWRSGVFNKGSVSLCGSFFQICCLSSKLEKGVEEKEDEWRTGKEEKLFPLFWALFW